MSFIPRRDFNACVARYKGDYRTRNLSCYDQFLVMCLAQYASKNSLRDIEASLKLCPWAKFRTTKAGIKMHTLLDLRGNLPVYIHLTDASVHDVKALDSLCVEMGAILILSVSWNGAYEDFATGKVYRFLTNHLGYEALTIAELYRERRNVELFFLKR